MNYIYSLNKDDGHWDFNIISISAVFKMLTRSLLLLFTVQYRIIVVVSRQCLQRNPKPGGTVRIYLANACYSRTDNELIRLDSS